MDSCTLEKKRNLKMAILIALIPALAWGSIGLVSG